jgi:hypothetical protein
MDESGKEGRFYSNFYGGVLVRSKDYDKVVKLLTEKKNEMNMFKEVKWQKISTNYLSKYIALMDLFFDLMEQDILKMRVMFTHNYNKVILPKGEQKNTFLKLYYQFFKHAFGLKYSNQNEEPIGLRIYFDELPISPTDKKMFKSYIQRLVENEEFKTANLFVKEEDITEVDSSKHVLLQYMDIVLGAMYFRLNEFHKEKPEGKRTRGKTTIAKDTLYKHINKRIREIYPNFNIGISTGVQSDIRNRWVHPYRHWCFLPTESTVASEYAKRK